MGKDAQQTAADKNPRRGCVEQRYLRPGIATSIDGSTPLHARAKYPPQAGMAQDVSS